MGAEVHNAYTSFVSTAVASGETLKLGYYAVPYQADSIWTLLSNGGLSQSSTFWTSIDVGVIQTLGILNQRAKLCSTETYVLAGYSQGAMVVHRTMLAMYHDTGLAATLNVGDRLLKRVTSALAIADGDRLGAQGGTHYGTAPNTNESWGISWFAATADPASTSGTYPPFKEPLPDDSRFQASSFIDVCLSGDVVCDNPNSPPFGGAVVAGMIHGNAYKTSSYVVDAAAAAYQIDATKRADAKAMRSWTVGPLTVHLNGDWGPVGSADPSNGYASDYTNQAPCTNCTTVPDPLISAEVGLSDYAAWCTDSSDVCNQEASNAVTRIGDAPAITVGGLTPDYSGRGQMYGYAGTNLFWCFSAEKVCITYDRPTDSPELQTSQALLDLLSNATWTG